MPQIMSIVKLEIKKPVFAQNINSQTLKEISKNQAQISKERSEQIKNIKRDRKTFYTDLKKSIREKSTQIRFNRLKESIIDRTENVLNQLLTKLRESR